MIGDLVEDVVVTRAGPLVRGDDNPATIRRTRGGSGANVAAAAARHVPVRFVGRVGDDAAGRSLTGELERRGVDVRVQRAGVTATVVILVDGSVGGDGERTMLPDRAAAAELGPVDPAWLAGTTWLHVPLYGFLTAGSRAAVLDAVATVRRGSAAVSVDLSSPSALAGLGADGLREVCGRVAPDVVFANEAEAAHPHAAALTGAWTLVTKRGAAPVRITAPGTDVEVPVPPVARVLDTTGAGDAFAAGYLEAALRGLPARECAARGNRRAAEVLARAGA